MDNLEKLRIFIPHWIEHNAEHAVELRTWAERMQLAGETDTGRRLSVAAELLGQACDQLAKLSDEIGEVAKI
jgi:hypothetical protein